MNSMSKGYYDSCGKERRKEEKQCPTIIKCGCPSTVTLPVVTTGSTDVVLASLTVDTSCICDPVIKLDFSSAFTTTVTAVLGGVTVQIFKQCRNQTTAVPVGPSWPVIGLIAAGALTGSIFTNFSICDTDACGEECCTYTAVATVSGTALAVIGATFNNSTLTSTITCRSNACTRDCNRRRCHCECDY